MVASSTRRSAMATAWAGDGRNSAHCRKGRFDTTIVERCRSLAQTTRKSSLAASRPRSEKPASSRIKRSEVVTRRKTLRWVASGRGAGGGPADEDDVAVLVDEAAGEELLDDLGGELRASGPVEALEGAGRAELAPAAPAPGLSLPAGGSAGP